MTIFSLQPSPLRNLIDNELYEKDAVRQNRKLLSKIEKPAKKKSQAKKKQKKLQKPKELVHGPFSTSKESFNCGDSNYIMSKDGFVALQWKDSKVVRIQYPLVFKGLFSVH